MANDKECFVIAPIGEPESEIRKSSDKVLKHIIKKVLAPLGYHVIRADMISKPGIITSQIIQHIVDAPLVVADLSGHNPNVFYELAIRHATRKPHIQLIKKSESIPFDIASTRTIFFDIQDIDTIEETQKELLKQVKSIENKEIEVESPISAALDLKALKGSDNPNKRALADIAANISQMKATLDILETRSKEEEQMRGFPLLTNRYFSSDKGAVWEPIERTSEVPSSAEKSADTLEKDPDNNIKQ